MGVLEAWKDIEKAGYPVVGEEVKDASNVIDYNIRPEQTKDASAVINANNDTTTGMANVIPGINAPKLLAETSIIGGKGNIEYAEIALGYDGTMTSGTSYNFNQLTITGDNFVSVDPNYPSYLLIGPGTYMAYLHIDVHNASREFYVSCRYWKSDGTLGIRIIEQDNCIEQYSIASMFMVTETGGHIRTAIRPDNGNVSNFNNDVLRLIKLA